MCCGEGRSGGRGCIVMADTLDSFDLAAFQALDGAARAAEAARLDRILRETGFLVLTGHGVPESVIAGVWEAAAGFFDSDAATKARVAAPPGYPYGWIGPDKEALARSRGEDTPPDLKESFNGGPGHAPDGMTDPEALASCYQPTLWPDLPGFRAKWEAYYTQMNRLAARIMSAMAEALGMPADHFATFIDAPISALRALHYPRTHGAALAGQQRAGAHTDYGSLTILLPQPRSRGLEVLAPSGAWVEAPTDPGAFIVNIGDLMARWTADRWVSTLHRVVAHPDQPPRQSLAYFHQPNWDAEIVPLDGGDSYPMVRSGPYLMAKFRAANST